MKRIRLSKRSFEVLYKGIQRNFEKICSSIGAKTPTGRAQDYFGFAVSTQKKEKRKTKDDDRQKMWTPSLHEVFQVHPKVKGQPKIPSPKYLYNLERQFQNLQKPYSSVEVDLDIINLYARFLSPARYSGTDRKITAEAWPDPTPAEDYVDFNDYLEKNLEYSGFDKRVQEIFLTAQAEGVLQPEFCTRYKAYYFYFPKNKIFEFDIRIDFINASGDSYPIELTNLHRLSNGEQDERLYAGGARQHSSCLSASLVNEEHDFPLSLIAYTSHHDASDMPILHASLQGISTSGHPTASEIVMVKTWERGEKISVEGNLDYLKYYLLIQRRYYRVPPRIIRNLKYLEARRIEARDIRALEGHYRIWTPVYDQRPDEDEQRRPTVLQSHFWITANEGAYFSTKRPKADRNNQPVMMSISHLEGRKLCLSTHLNQSTTVINYVIMDLPDRSFERNGRGVYCTFSSDGQLLAEPFVYRRETETVEVQNLSEEELLAVTRGELHDLYQMLMKELVRQRDWLDAYVKAMPEGSKP